MSFWHVLTELWPPIVVFVVGAPVIAYFEWDHHRRRKP